MSIHGLAQFLASQLEQSWSCTCLDDDIGDDKARFKQYRDVQILAVTPRNGNV